jgi:hypothetical protein
MIRHGVSPSSSWNGKVNNKDASKPLSLLGNKDGKSSRDPSSSKQQLQRPTTPVAGDRIIITNSSSNSEKTPSPRRSIITTITAYPATVMMNLRVQDCTDSTTINSHHHHHANNNPNWIFIMRWIIMGIAIGSSASSIVQSMSMPSSSCFGGGSHEATVHDEVVTSTRAHPLQQTIPTANKKLATPPPAKKKAAHQGKENIATTYC